MTVSQTFAYSLNLVSAWPSIQLPFTVLPRIAVLLLVLWPAVAASADPASAVTSRVLLGLDEPGKPPLTGDSSEAVTKSRDDHAPTNHSSDLLSSGDRLAELIRATRNPKWKTRWDAVNELGNLKDARGVPALVDRALYDDNPHPRWRSLWAMSAIDRKGTDAVPRLLVALESEDPNVLHNAAIALAFFGRPEARAQLLRALSDPIEFRRWEAVYSFRDLGNAAVVDALLPLLDVVNESSTRVRGETALVLGRIGDDTVVPALVRTLRADVSREVRWRAALALMNAGNTCLIDGLQGVRSAETDTRVREQISKTIAAMARSNRHRECPDGAQTGAQPREAE